MRTTFFSLLGPLLMSWLAGCTSAAAGQGSASSTTSHATTPAPLAIATVDPPANLWLGAAPANTHITVGENAELPIGIWVDVPEDAARGQARQPMAVSLIIDASGSMEGEKILNARHAAVSFLSTLVDGDLVSIYTFADDVTEIAAPTILDGNNRAFLTDAVSRIEANGGTNMYAGVTAGQARMAQATERHPVRRLVVISDGQANIGPHAPEDFERIAVQGTEHGAQISSIGVGLGYDESTLAALTLRSSGRMYHLANPAQMESILDQELNLLALTVATSAVVHVTPAPGVELLGLAVGEATLVDGQLEIPLGSLFAGQSRELLVRARVHPTREGASDLARIELRFVATADPSNVETQHSSLRFAVTHDASLAHESAQPRVAAMLASFQAAQAQLVATALLNEGRSEEATAQLQVAEDQLEIAAAAAPASPAREKLKDQVGKVRRNREAASRARSKGEARSVALESHAAAYGAMGY